jgi:hypothetical protein
MKTQFAVVQGQGGDTIRSTVLPGATLSFAGGFWLITDRGGTLAIGEVVTVPTLSPALASVVVATSFFWPTTLGSDGYLKSGSSQIGSGPMPLT